MPIWLWITLAALTPSALFVAFGTRHQTVRRHPTNALYWRTGGVMPTPPLRQRTAPTTSASSEEDPDA